MDATASLGSFAVGAAFVFSVASTRSAAYGLGLTDGEVPFGFGFPIGISNDSLFFFLHRCDESFCPADIFLREHCGVDGIGQGVAKSGVAWVAGGAWEKRDGIAEDGASFTMR